MSYRLIIRPEAELDIQDAFEWYEAQTLGLGSEFVRAVDTCLSGIERNPLAYPVIYKQARRSLMRRFPYGILYVFDQDLITELRAFTVNVIRNHGKLASSIRVGIAHIIFSGLLNYELSLTF